MWAIAVALGGGFQGFVLSTTSRFGPYGKWAMHMGNGRNTPCGLLPIRLGGDAGVLFCRQRDDSAIMGNGQCTWGMVAIYHVGYCRCRWGGIPGFCFCGKGRSRVFWEMGN